MTILPGADEEDVQENRESDQPVDKLGLPTAEYDDDK